MTFKLIFENLRHRPLRSLLSVLLIAIPVTLILTLVGLSEGMLSETERRMRGVGADILVKSPGAAVMSFSGASIPQKLVDTLATWPHITVATGTMVQPLGGGISNVTGVDLEAFNRLNGGFKYLEGTPFQAARRHPHRRILRPPAESPRRQHGQRAQPRLAGSGHRRARQIGPHHPALGRTAGADGQHRQGQPDLSQSRQRPKTFPS